MGDRFIWSTAFSSIAAYGNHRHIFDWLETERLKTVFSEVINPLLYDSIAAAAGLGNESLLIWLHQSKGYSLPAFILKYIGEGGSLSLFKWTQSRHDASGDSVHSYSGRVQCLTAAAQYGRDEMVEWYMDNASHEFNPAIYQYLASNRKESLLRCLHEKGARFPSEIIQSAVNSCNIPLLEWLLQAGYQWFPETSREVISRGDWQLYRWLLDHGYPLPHINRIVLEIKKSNVRL